MDPAKTALLLIDNAAALEMVTVEGGVFGRVATTDEIAGELQ